MELAAFRKPLHDEMTRGFDSPEILQNWVKIHFGDENVYNIIIAATRFDTQLLALLDWVEAAGKVFDFLQALADHPPRSDPRLPVLIYAWTLGTVMPASSRLSGIPPIPPFQDWFVTQRPFANRKGLRAFLASLETALPGPDSVLVIEGPRHSGKSLSINFAAQCAPRHRAVTVDIDIWGENMVYANELAGALDPSGSGVPEIDQTKEDAAVPQLLIGLTGKLRDTNTWIIIDHCNRPNLTRASEELLLRLAANIERGFLPGVRLIVADFERAKLPGALKSGSRYDYAQLPDRDAVKEWFTSLADHLKKAYKEDEIMTYVEEVFVGFPPVIAGPDHTTELDNRLRTVFARIQSLGG